MLFQLSSFSLLFIVVFLFAGAFSGSVQASTVVSVNEASVAVSDQSSTTQKKAARQALEQVVIKITGQRSATSNSAVRAMLSQPERYLRAYRFDVVNGQLSYVAEFDSQTVIKVIRDAGLPVWGQRRPDTLLWLATEDENGNRQIIDDGAKGPVSSRLRELAVERGVPVVFPLMDLDDSVNISVFDVWGRFARTLQTASVRYQPDYIVGARLYKVKMNAVPDIEEEQQTREQASAFRYDTYRPAFSNNGLQDLNTYLVDDLVEEARSPAFTRSEFEAMSQKHTQGDWALDWVVIKNNDIQFGTLYEEDEDSLTALFFEEYSDYLGQHFSVSSGDEQTEVNNIFISVANVDSLEKYVHAREYMEQMSMVSHVSLVSQKGSVATFSLSLLSQTSDFFKLVSLDSKLKPVSDVSGNPLDGLNFYWNE